MEQIEDVNTELQQVKGSVHQNLEGGRTKELIQSIFFVFVSYTLFLN